MAAVKQRHNEARQQGRSFHLNKSRNVHDRTVAWSLPPSPRDPKPQTPDHALCACVPRHPRLPLQTLRRYLLPTNLNLIKCLGQPNFIYLALPTTFATRQSPSNGQATLCQCRDLSTSVMHGIIFSFSPQRAIFLQHMIHAAIIGYPQARSQEPGASPNYLFAFAFHL